MNIAMSSENLGLQHDNKQLNALIKDFETTLETLMTKFRNRAQDVQERELSLIREYESKLLALEEENAYQELANSTALSESLARLSCVLRHVLRIHGGEEPESDTNECADSSDSPPPVTPTNFDENCEPGASATGAGYALEREIELARLEKENEELRRMLGLVPSYPSRRSLHQQNSGSDGSVSSRMPPFEPVSRPMRIPSQPTTGSQTQQQQLPQSLSPPQQRPGGVTSSVGSIGSFKRTRP